jgi:hypothetical protein
VLCVRSKPSRHLRVIAVRSIEHGANDVDARRHLWRLVNIATESSAHRLRTNDGHFLQYESSLNAHLTKVSRQRDRVVRNVRDQFEQPLALS